LNMAPGVGERHVYSRSRLDTFLVDARLRPA
jgi:hypothetical protein